ASCQPPSTVLIDQPSGLAQTPHELGDEERIAVGAEFERTRKLIVGGLDRIIRERAQQLRHVSGLEALQINPEHVRLTMQVPQQLAKRVVLYELQDAACG